MKSRKPSANSHAHSEWRAFTQYLRSENRFFLDDGWQSFVDGVMASVHSRQAIEKRGGRFFRARIHEFENFDSGYTLHEMGQPPAAKTPAGRLNPPGLPCLYLSSNAATAIAEVRPWLGAHVTIAEFVLARDARIIDVTAKAWHGRSDGPASREQEAIWREINAAFAIPYHPDDKVGYLPTQYLAELFKHAGFEGVRYGSALKASGYNLALFVARKAAPRRLTRTSISKIRYFHSRAIPG